MKLIVTYWSYWHNFCKLSR